MRERGISKEDVEAVLRRPEGDPDPGTGLGNIVITGRAGGRRLKVVCSADGGTIVTAFWA
jgi:hypothetical protein